MSVKTAKKPYKKVEEEPIEITPAEFFQISRELERYHAIFYQFWELGVPMFSKRIPTAAVCFDKEGHCVNFLFNPDFWKGLTTTQRNFIISHECLHVILRHGVRSKDCENKDGANVAMDVVINEMLCEQFGYDRKEIDPDNKLCWMDTIFHNDPEVEKGQSFEYYFKRLPADYKIPDGTMLVDIHDFLDKDIDNILKKLGPSLTDEEKKKIRDIVRKQLRSPIQGGTSAGTVALGDWLSVGNQNIKPKQKWETVIRKWMRKYLPNEFDMYEHWARVNRRMVLIPDDALLPSEMELQDKEVEGKIKVFFYLDTSGSCVHLADRFWKAAKSLPKNRFDVRLFCFDVEVYPVTPEMEKKGKVRGGGGTNFEIIEGSIQKIIKADALKTGGVVTYPEAVFVISDGEGTPFKTPKPDRWYWFLTERNSQQYIPKSSKKYLLKDYE